ncbi:hypothetical protein A4S02_12780 [Acetobacter ascendens]|uniref:Uncharacterized protein n=1 Tax=Acetobacter ascendens TaxID=481146 RepID=A0A1D8QYS7_9PROT|nr:hypothetical protein A4S02_12780 [Acetobacter ascendens]
MDGGVSFLLRIWRLFVFRGLWWFIACFCTLLVVQTGVEIKMARQGCCVGLMSMLEAAPMVACCKTFNG